MQRRPCFIRPCCARDKQTKKDAYMEKGRLLETFHLSEEQIGMKHYPKRCVKISLGEELVCSWHYIWNEKRSTANSATKKKTNRSVQTYTIHRFLPHLEVKQTNERLETSASENSRNGDGNKKRVSTMIREKITVKILKVTAMRTLTAFRINPPCLCLLLY